MTDIQESNRGLHILWKRLGETPLECLERFRAEHRELGNLPMTYAGRLDPMAEGVMVVLAGDEVKEKQKYLGMEKEYEVEILWGFETDTLDVLGKALNESSRLNLDVDALHLVEVLGKSTGKFVQKYPAYSSKTVKGIPLFQWAREGKIHEIEIPEHEVEIVEVPVYKSRREISGKELLQHIEEKIALVKGDFRQQEIISAWRDALSTRQAETFTIDTVSMHVSSGFYVRQFVSDLARSLGTCAVAFHIRRTKVGDFCI